MSFESIEFTVLGVRVSALKFKVCSVVCRSPFVDVLGVEDVGLQCGAMVAEIAMEVAEAELLKRSCGICVAQQLRKQRGQLRTLNCGSAVAEFTLIES